jgi:penicillin-binding protein 1C
VSRLDAKPGRYGLSAAVGGLELSPLELAGLFTTLATSGIHRPLRLVRDGSAPDVGVRLLSPGAAYLTRQALTARDRPDFPTRRQLGGDAPILAWKTGTSFGHRDAWTAGFGRDLVAVVWLGNFDQRGTPGLVGAEVAAPIFFDLLEATRSGLPAEASAPPPADLQPIEVCAYSGHPPSPACPSRRQALARTRGVPTARCPYHQSVEVDVASGLAVTPLCRGRYTTERRTFLWWPPSLRRFLHEQRQELPAVPQYAPGCAPPETRSPPVLLSPRAGQVVLLIPGLPAERQAVPLAAETQQAATLSWFVDGEFLGTRPPEERLWWTPRPGAHEIVVTDEAGRSARRTLRVQPAE